MELPLDGRSLLSALREFVGTHSTKSNELLRTMLFNSIASKGREITFGLRRHSGHFLISFLSVPGEKILLRTSVQTEMAIFLKRKEATGVTQFKTILWQV